MVSPTRSVKLSLAPRARAVAAKTNGNGGHDVDTNGSGMRGRAVSASRTEMVEVVLPQDANVLGNVLGGRVMHLVDIAGAIAALRHSRSHVVTASLDHVDFHSPIRVGELIVLQSSVNRVFHTSMEVGVKVLSESPLTGVRKHATSAYLTYVAVDSEGHPRVAPPLILETADDRRRFKGALKRRNLRLAQHKPKA
ncbi:MAG: acyl-CoA thioesterase [Candidatus Acidiferrales bacterium]